MANFKLYYLSQSDFDTKVKNAKMPLQQIQIYRALANLGKPSRGVDVIDAAVKEQGLITRQDYAVLAAWYFSPKRRPDCVRLGEPTIVEEDLADKITRLTDEIETKQLELMEAQEAFKKMVDEEGELESEEPGNEDPNAKGLDAGDTGEAAEANMNAQATPPAETETPAPEAEQPETKKNRKRA